MEVVQTKLISKKQFEEAARQVLFDVTSYHFMDNEFMAKVIDKAWSLIELPSEEKIGELLKEIIITGNRG